MVVKLLSVTGARNGVKYRFVSAKHLAHFVVIERHHRSNELKAKFPSRRSDHSLLNEIERERHTSKRSARYLKDEEKYFAESKLCVIFAEFESRLVCPYSLWPYLLIRPYYRVITDKVR